MQIKFKTLHKKYLVKTAKELLNKTTELEGVKDDVVESVDEQSGTSIRGIAMGNPNHLIWRYDMRSGGYVVNFNLKKTKRD